MSPFLVIWGLVFVLGQEPVAQTQFIQVAPPVAAGQPLHRSSGQTHAVVLIHGFKSPKKGETKPESPSCQQPNSPVVKHLAPGADVFALAYEETMPVSEYAALSAIREDIQSIRDQGYEEIVLVGFGAGGLIARQFVEDAAESGVTKVIQVDSPNWGNGGSSDNHDVFQRSLSNKARQEFLDRRLEKKIPDAIQFACVIDSGLVESEPSVSSYKAVASKWPRDLQEQGIQGRLVTTKYLWSSRSEEGARMIAELVKENLYRWSAKQSAAMREKIVHVTVAPPN